MAPYPTGPLSPVSLASDPPRKMALKTEGSPTAGSASSCEKKYFVSGLISSTLAVCGAGPRAQDCKQRRSTGVHSTALVRHSPDHLTLCVHRSQIKYRRISCKNSFVSGKPAREPMTDSMPQRGQRAVAPPSRSVIQSRISDGRKVFRQWKHPQRSLATISSRWEDEWRCADSRTALVCLGLLMTALSPTIRITAAAPVMSGLEQQPHRGSR
jgi:hypothetical protein